MADKEKPIYITTWNGKLILNNAGALLDLPSVRRDLTRVAEIVKKDPSVRVATHRLR